MRKSNEQITLSFDDAVEIYKALEVLVVSLDQIGSHYYDLSQEELQRELARFIAEWCIFRRAAQARGILGRRFDLTLGDDGRDDLERACQDVPYWERPGNKPGDLEQVLLRDFLLDVFHLGDPRERAVTEETTLDDLRMEFADSLMEEPAPDEIDELMRDEILESYKVDISILSNRRIMTVVRAILQVQEED